MGSRAGRNVPRVQARASGRRSPSPVCNDTPMDNDNWIAIMTGFEHTTSSQSTQCLPQPGGQKCHDRDIPWQSTHSPHQLASAGEGSTLQWTGSTTATPYAGCLNTATVVQFQIFVGIARVPDATPDDVPGLAPIHFWTSAS